VRRQWYRKIFEEIQKGFNMNSSDAVHGSLLALAMIFKSASKVSVTNAVLGWTILRDLRNCIPL
jgi:hypothetical protein